MADMRTWSHEFLSEFIELYKSFPCLYNVKSKDYSNKPLKVAAYDKLVAKLKIADPKATKDTVVRKINNMRRSYRKEMKKIKETKRSGASGEIYETSLWYFHLLNFLYEHEIPRKSQSNIHDLKNESENDGHENENNDLAKESGNSLQLSKNEEDASQNEILKNQDRLQSTSNPGTPSNIGSISHTKSRKRKATETEQQVTVFKVATENSQSQHKFSNYADYVGEELAALPPMMATYCKKLINDVLFEAACGTLNKKSRIVTGVPDAVTNQREQNSRQYITPESVPRQ